MEAQTVEQMLQALAAADNKVATARGALKEAESEYEAIADRIFAKMESEGTDQFRSKRVGLSVSIQEADVYTFADWSALEKFIRRNPDALALFQRRLSNPAVRALIEQRGGREIPGIGVFTKKRLHVNKVKE